MFEQSAASYADGIQISESIVRASGVPIACCYAFVIAERVRHFLPSTRGPLEDNTQSFAA